MATSALGLTDRRDHSPARRPDSAEKPLIKDAQTEGKKGRREKERKERRVQEDECREKK